MGRITEVSHQFWKVDLFGVQHAMLHLHSINFGGTQLRRLQASDEYNMRKFFVEGDMISVRDV